MKKKAILVIAVLLVLWLAMAVTDAYLVIHAFEKPVFCVLINGADDGGSGTYLGLGYSFDIQGNFMPLDEFPGVTQFRYRIFGLDVKSGIRD